VHTGSYGLMPADGSPGLDVLAWVAASSRASVLSGFVRAAAATGGSDAGDAESVAARFIDWLSRTTRPWLVVLDDLRDAADLEGLWPSGPAGSLASASFAAGRMGSALQLYEETCAGYQRSIGAYHPATLACQTELARVYYATGRLGDAITLLTDGISRAEQALPPDDPLTRRMREALTNITG
jgi:Tetratricopeptide repeat